MQFKRAIMAGALGALMVGSTVAFAATSLSDYPKPFVSGSTVDALIVVGASAAPSDVVGAIDLAARLGGEPVTKETVTCPGSSAGTSVSGEGKAVFTTNTKLYLQDNLGKSGVRSTFTSSDLTTLLKKGTFQDSNGNQANYKQYIYLTPGAAGTAANYRIDFDRPGSSSTADPTFNIGRFTTSPSTTEYLYKTYVSFEKTINSTLAIGEKLTLFGKEYTVQSGTDFVNAPTKLILAGGAETKILTAGESYTTTLGGVSYEVTLTGVSDSTHAIIKVKSPTAEDQRTITKSTSNKVAGLDVYVSDAYYLSSTDPSKNSAKVLLGAEKLTLKDTSKVLKGDTEDPVDGTYVILTEPSGQLSSFTVYEGASSSTTDYIASGSSYKDPVWKSFSVRFDGPATSMLTGSDRDLLQVSNSGINLLQASITPELGSTQSISFAYKATATGTTFSLADSSGDAIQVLEGATISRDQYIILDAADFTHMYEVTSVSLDSSTSSSVDLRDVFSGSTTKITTGTDNIDTAYIDGQAYYFNNVSATTFKATWGAGAADGAVGTWTTVFPVLKGKNGEKYAFFKPSVNVSVTSGTKIQLPSGSLLFTYNGSDTSWNITATTNEDGTSSYISEVDSVAATTVGNWNMSSGTKAIKLGKSASSGVYYNITGGGVNNSVLINVSGSTAVSETQPGILMIEEKDGDSNYNAVLVSASTESSGSNNVAIANTPEFTATVSQSDSLGTDSNRYQYVDIYGTFADRNTKDQDVVKIYYPDEQVTMDLYILAEGASVSTSGAVSGKTVEKTTVSPIKTAVAKLDAEVTQQDKLTKNLILVGGPVVNKLVSELATANKTKDTAYFRTKGAGYYLIQAVNDAFTSGKVALVVAGYEAADTRLATSKLQAFDTAGLSGSSFESK